MITRSLRFACRQVLATARASRGTMLVSAGLVFAIAPGAHTAQAQEAPAAERADSVLTEVVVTARRREESAQEVPIAITAFSGDALEDRQITNLESVQAAVPEFSISQSSGRPNAPVYGLRGIRPTEAIYGQDPTVAVYFADVVMSPAAGTNLGLYDLESLQVLKGPQGTLFGRNTTGGALLMTPRKPGKEFGADLMVGYGTYGRNESQIGIDMPFSDSFAMRLAGRAISSEGYQTNVAPGPLYGSKLAGEDTQSVRLSAVLNVGVVENYTVLSYDHKTTNGRGTVLTAINGNPNSTVHCYDGPGNPLGNNTGIIPGTNTPAPPNPGTPCAASNATSGAAAAGEPLPNYFDALTRAENRDVHDVESDMLQYDKIRVWGVVNTTSINLGDDLVLKGIGGYRDFAADSAYDIDASLIPGILTSIQAEELKHASYEVQLLGSSFDSLNWVAGLYWYYEDGNQLSPGDVSRGLSATTVPFTQAGAVHNNSYSGFAQGTYKFVDSLSLTAGVRYTIDEKEMTIGTHTVTLCLSTPSGTPAAPPTPGNFSNCEITLSDSFSKTTGTLSLDYQVADGVLLYATSRYGYRSGGFNLRATTPIQYKPFQPETVLDFEVGTKADWSLGDVAMRSNAAIYQQWYDNIQRTVGVQTPGATAAVPGSAVQNAAKANVFGVELQQTIAPTRELSLQVNYAYTHPKYKDWTEIGSDPINPAAPAPQRVFPVVDLSDTPFHFTPKHSVSGTLTYAIPLANAGEELQLSANASYRSGVWINALQTSAAIKRTPQNILPAMQQGGNSLLDLAANWKGVHGSALDISAYVKNALDKEYVVGGIQLYESSYVNVSRTGFVTRAYAEPRTYGAQLRYKF